MKKTNNINHLYYLYSIYLSLFEKLTLFNEKKEK